MVPVANAKNRFLWLLIAGAVLGGCITPGAAPNWPPALTDPPGLSPQHRPLFRPHAAPAEPQPVPVQPSPAQPVPAHPGAEPPALEGEPPVPIPETFEPPGQPEAVPDGGPLIVPPGTAATANLELTVDAPARKQVGSGATFRLTVRNAGQRPVEEAAVEARFDEPLAFPGSTEKTVRRLLGPIDVGESREFALTLVGSKPGNWCTAFTVTADGREAVWKSVCVEFVPRRLEVTIVGPPARTVGSRAEFTVKLVNVSNEDLKDVEAAVAFDAVFEPKEGTRGARPEPGRLTWDVGALPSGEGVQLQVEFECRTPSQQACVVAEVTAGGVPRERAEACLPITPVRGPLDVQVSDTRDPLTVDEQTDYVVTVLNRGPDAARSVRLKATVPANVEVAGAEVLLGEKRVPVKSETKGRQVEFDPVETLPADGELTFRVRVKALAPGDGRFRAEVTAAAQDQPIESVEPTTVNPGGR